MAADFQNVYRYNVCLCSSVVLADVLEHNCNPAGENELRFVVGTCVFLSHSSVLPPELNRGKKCGCECECVFIYRTYHIVSQGGLQFYLREIGRQLVKAPLAAAISPYLISPTHPTHA